MKRVCPRPGCEVSATGVCVEGFKAAEECPYTHVVDTAADDVEAEHGTDAEYISVSKGEALTLEDANTIASTRPCRLVVLAGAAESGKTTILTSLYEKFLDAPFAGFEFAGSDTLAGFERRCFLGRAYSGRTLPETSRTSANRDARILHLRLSRNGQANTPDLLFVDVSGEQFRLARDTDRGAQALSFVQRADSLALLIDGDKLANLTLRAVAYQDARSILRSLIENELLGMHVDVEVLFTKWDVLGPAAQDAQDGFLERVEKEMKAAFSDYRISFAPVAARPDYDAALPFAHGLGELLNRWCGPPRRPQTIKAARNSDRTLRQSWRFAERELRKGDDDGAA